MYPTSTYVVRQAPSRGCRMARHAPQFSRQLSGGPGFFPSAPFWGALAGRQHPFFGGGRGRDIFDHFDDFVNRSFDSFPPASRADRRMRGSPDHFNWQPCFDVSEVDNAYQLHGELPGVEAQDLDVQFTDANTLVISGKTETQRTEGNRSQEQQDNDVNMSVADNTQNAAQAEAKETDAASVHSDASSYVQPTVEDEVDASAQENGSTTAGAPTPNTAESAATDAQEQSSKQAEAQQPQPRYWVSERSTGSFQRTFSFSNRVDPEGVTASLKNGILDIVVPKAKVPEAKKITVQ